MFTPYPLNTIDMIVNLIIEHHITFIYSLFRIPKLLLGVNEQEVILLTRNLILAQPILSEPGLWVAESVVEFKVEMFF